MLNRKAVSASVTAGVTGATLVAVVAIVALTGSVPTAMAATTTYTPVADTYVDRKSASTNFGTSVELGVDTSPVKRTFLKFSVNNLNAPVSSAKLRIHTDDESGARSGNGGTFTAMTDTTWSETGVTYDNQPAISGATLGSLGSVARNAWYEVDVTPLITGNGTFSIGVTSSSSDGTDYDSRETGATAPQLVVTSDSTPTTPPAGDQVLVGAGDIATSGNDDAATADLLDGISGTVFTVGDNAYPDGTAANFTTYYAPTWGRHKARTRPSPGNHDYHRSSASAYYSYFGANAGPAGKGYYSYDLGNWHVVSLNSEISMFAGSAQETWLRSDLADNTKPCTFAYWHKPRFTSSANHAPAVETGPLVKALYDHNAEVIVTGHNHLYERFAPMNPSGQADATRGIRHFVAGMGGAGLYSFGTIQPNSEARNNDTFGVLKFTLSSTSYTWQFVPVAGKTYTDSGTTACH